MNRRDFLKVAGLTSLLELADCSRNSKRAHSVDTDATLDLAEKYKSMSVDEKAELLSKMYDGKAVLIPVEPEPYRFGEIINGNSKIHLSRDSVKVNGAYALYDAQGFEISRAGECLKVENGKPAPYMSVYFDGTLQPSGLSKGKKTNILEIPKGYSLLKIIGEPQVRNDNFHPNALVYADFSLAVGNDLRSIKFGDLNTLQAGLKKIGYIN